MVNHTIHPSLANIGTPPKTQDEEPYRQPGYLSATALPDGHLVAVSRCLDPRMLSVAYVTDFGATGNRIAIPATGLPQMIALLQDAQRRIESDAERISDLAARSVRERVAVQ